MQDLQNGTLDDIIEIHEDLCTVVFNTVSAYSVWFVVHWFSYGAGIVVEIILISKEMMTDKNPTPVVYKVYICHLLVCFLYVFILPCFCAARITSKCAGKRNKLAINWSFTLAYYDHERRGGLIPQHFNATYRNIVGSCCEMLFGTTCCMRLATLLQHVG